MQARQQLIITNVEVYMEDQIIKNGYVKVVDGVIKEIGDSQNILDVDFDGYTIQQVPDGYALLPGMIDIHIHGATGADTMDATPEALETMAHTLPKEGTTSFLATTMTQSAEAIENALQNVSTYIGNQQPGNAEVLGIHLEGPFISLERKGAQKDKFIIKPNLHLFKKWQEIANGAIKLVTLAPEQPGGMELIRYLKETGVVASIGHSDGTFKEVEQAIAAGANHVTHMYNGMSGFHHREPGVVGAALLRDELTIEIIADGIHAHPEAINLAYRTKTKDKIILITDAIRAKGLGEGTYDLGGQEVTVTDKKATLTDGTLAGSILKMKDAMKNFMSFTGCSLHDIMVMTAINPAKQLNVFDRKGSIQVGKDADLVLLDLEHDVHMTFCRGLLAYTKQE